MLFENTAEIQRVVIADGLGYLSHTVIGII